MFIHFDFSCLFEMYNLEAVTCHNLSTLITRLISCSDRIECLSKQMIVIRGRPRFTSKGSTSNNMGGGGGGKIENGFTVEPCGRTKGGHYSKVVFI